MLKTLKELIETADIATPTFQTYSGFYTYANDIAKMNRLNRPELNLLRSKMRLVYLNRHHPL
jgi:hypothetical protein